ncbi:MAG: DUF1707 domain-containing protein [Streptosporangiaceae bacterium]|nr:DUF1707 domain-containing protein [Streptosporangiaceae bacterium]
MSSRQAPRDLRASDSDRDRVLAVLADAVGDGRITQDEFHERASVACSAKTLGELAGLTADLSEVPLVRLDGGQAIAGIFASARRDGRWVVPEAVTVTAVRGTVEVDFTEALLQASHVTVNVTVVVGKVLLIVPDGIRVEVTGRALLGRRALGRNTGGAAAIATAGPEAPVIDVRSLILGGKLEVRTPPRPRRFRLFPRR